MDKRPWLRDKALNVLLGLLFLPLLYMVHRYNHTLSHDVAEMFSVIVACGIFMFTWNARPFIENHYYLYLGIAYLFVGGFDFIHAMAYEGVFRGDRSDVPTQLWFAGRYLQSLSLFIAPFFAGRKLNERVLLSAYSLAAFLLLGSIFAWGVFPVFYVQGRGVTPFKTYSDSFIAIVLLASAVSLYSKREHFDRDVFHFLLGSIGFSIASELACHLYVDEHYVYNNLLGHYLKVVSFYLIYKAVIQTGLFRPYGLLFRDLKRNEEELRLARDGLEVRVADRTSELKNVNERLERELDQRRRVEKERGLTIDLLRLINSTPNVREGLKAMISFLGDWAGCEAVGIRLRRGVDFPYIETRGFSEEFVRAESRIVAVGGNGAPILDAEGRPVFECLCGSVLCGRSEASRLYLSGHGSFWTNSTSGWLAGLGGAERPPAVRGRCHADGYESVALVPLRLGAETLGLLHFNDRRPGRFSTDLISQLERAGDNIATALSRLLAEDALRESEARFRSLVEDLPAGIMIVLDGRVVFRNPAQEKLIGPKADGFRFRDIGDVHPDDRPKLDRFCEAMESRNPSRQEMDLRFRLEGEDAADSPTRWVQCQASPIDYRGKPATLVNMVDISKVKEFERVVATREKLATIGQLAAGIAHEIRNPLSGIDVNVSTLGYLCGQAEGLDPETKEKIDTTIGQAKSASRKIASVIRKVMDFSKSVPPLFDRVDVNDVIEEAIDFSSVTLRKGNIELHKSLAADLPGCRADRQLLERVLINLITNALQAMESSGGAGKLGIGSSLEGDRIVIKVSDSGPGVPTHVRSKIFDPFYTTRKDGHGIGLSFSHRVVSDHGGFMSVGKSRWGGAEFRVELPLALAEVPG